MSSPTFAAAPARPPWPTGSGASSSSRPEPGAARAGEPEPARVGRDGLLELAFARRGDRTVLTGRRYRLPLQALEPADLDGTGRLVLALLNPTGGVLGGDVLETRVALGPGTRVCLTTPSATRVYRSAGPAARQRLVAEIADGAALEYVPDHLIPSPGARLVQSTELRLARGAVAIVADGWAVGRVARGERWRFDMLDLGLEAHDDGGRLLKERAILAGGTRWARLGAADGHDYVGTFAALAPARDGWESLAAALGEAAGAVPGAAVGVAALARGGALGRVLARSAPALRGALDALWSAARGALLGLPPLDLRKL